MGNIIIVLKAGWKGLIYIYYAEHMKQKTLICRS